MLEFACRSCGALVEAESMDQIFKWEKICKKCFRHTVRVCSRCKKNFKSKRVERFCSPECRLADKDEKEEPLEKRNFSLLTE